MRIRVKPPSPPHVPSYSFASKRVRARNAIAKINARASMSKLDRMNGPPDVSAGQYWGGVGAVEVALINRTPRKEIR